MVTKNKFALQDWQAFSGNGVNLPPAYVRTTGGYVFTGVCLFNFRGGYPISGLGKGGYTISGLR